MKHNRKDVKPGDVVMFFAILACVIVAIVGSATDKWDVRKPTVTDQLNVGVEGVETDFKMLPKDPFQSNKTTAGLVISGISLMGIGLILMLAKECGVGVIFLLVGSILSIIGCSLFATNKDTKPQKMLGGKVELGYSWYLTLIGSCAVLVLAIIAGGMDLHQHNSKR